jgi:hypothetical protein
MTDPVIPEHVAVGKRKAAYFAAVILEDMKGAGLVEEMEEVFERLFVRHGLSLLEEQADGSNGVKVEYRPFAAMVLQVCREVTESPLPTELKRRRIREALEQSGY